MFMDIFNFFATRDLNLEATILAGNELAMVTARETKNIGVITEEVKTPDTDEIMEDVVFTLHDLHFQKQKCSIWNANLKIQRKSGMNLLSATTATLIFQKR